MKSRLWIVTAREYLGQIKNPVFWITTLALPAFIIAVNLIVLLSSQSAKDTEKQAVDSAHIVIIDEANLIELPSDNKKLSESTDKSGSIAKVEKGELDAVLVVPAQVVKDKKVEIYQKDTGLGTRERYTDLAKQLVKNSILAKVGNPELIALFNSDIQTDTKTFATDGKPAPDLSSVIVPAIVGVLFLFLVTFSASNLLTSVSEEKENRAMEIVLTSVTPRQLIWGKILGITLSGLTQLVVLGLCGVAVLLLFGSQQLAFLHSASLAIDPLRLGFAFFIVLSGYLMMSCLLAAIGALTPTAKDASSFSSTVMIGAFFPLYFISAIITNPTSQLAYLTSYFPLTAPVILLTRNALGTIPPSEMLLSCVIMIAYVFGALLIATKAFQVGALEYGNRVSIKSLFQK